VAYAKKKGLRVVFYTNAALLDDKMAIGLLNAGVDQIRFSVDAMSAEDYEPLRKGLKWDIVLANIENFQKRKLEGNFQTETILRMCVGQENKDKISEVMEFWKDKVDLVATMPERNIAGYAETFACPFTNHRPIKCENPYTQLAVKSNGDVVLCCVDWFHNYVIGNVNDRPITIDNLLRLFNSGLYNHMRHGLETGIDIPSKCLSCTGYIQPKRWETDDS
jgi:radical SAM protein with 4Fe4S-binding SPASM domain